MEFSGRSVDEAIFHGLMEMGVTIDEVEIETIQKATQGIFGFGAKNAIVRLTERETPLVVDAEQLKEEHRAEQAAERAARKENHFGRSDRKPRKEGKEEKRKDDRRKGERRERRPVAAVEENIAYSEEFAAEQPACKFLGEMLEKMNVPCKLSAAEEDGGLRIRIDTDTDGLLIGRRGETLDALQYLVSLYVNHGREDYLRVTLDTEGYRARREEALRGLARREAAKVRSTGKSVRMEPMNPYERRILHSALQDFAGVTTYSEGEEPDRFVIIAPEE